MVRSEMAQEQEVQTQGRCLLPSPWEHRLLQSSNNSIGPQMVRKYSEVSRLPLLPIPAGAGITRRILSQHIGHTVRCPKVGGHRAATLACHWLTQSCPRAP